MVTNAKIAEAHGVKTNTVDHWPAEKRNKARRDIEAGVNPIIAELVGELQRECYVAMCHTGRTFEVYFNGKYVFCVVRTDAYEHGIESAYIADNAPLNPYELQGAIVKVKELYK